MIKKYISEITYDDLVIKYDLKNFKYMQYLEYLRSSKVKDKNLNKVGQEIKIKGKR